MIARLDGTLAAQGLDRIELRTASGVTYEVMVPLTVLATLPRLGGDLSLFTSMVVREDAWTLYGFPNADERKLFQRLMGTTGVGPSLAMNLLSTLSGERLVRAVREGDLATLTQVPRVGKKLAERLVLELRDKLDGALDGAFDGAFGGAAPGAAIPAGSPSADAVRALVALGYQTMDAERAVRRAREGAPKGETTADLVRRSLTALAK